MANHKGFTDREEIEEALAEMRGQNKEDDQLDEMYAKGTPPPMYYADDPYDDFPY